MDHLASTGYAAAADDQPCVTTLPPLGYRGEPALSDLLCDPIAEALMAADRVGHDDLDALLETARCHLGLVGAGPQQ